MYVIRLRVYRVWVIARKRTRPYSRAMRLALASLLVAAAGLAARPAAIVPPAVEVRAQARAQQPGELVVLSITAPADVTRVQVRVFDRDWPAFRTGDGTWRALVGIDLDTRARTYDARITTASAGAAVKTAAASGADGATTVWPLVVKNKTFRTRRLTVDDAYVNPPAAVQDRIAREARELAALWTSSAPEPLWTGPFVRPVPQAANSAFGSRSILNGTPRSPHSGADFASPAGTPIAAPNDGRVVLARPLYYTGNTVVIDHGLGLVTLFAHLSSTAVSVNDRVTAGQIVGKVGQTGRVTGPHLHWTLRDNGARIDPLSLLAVLGKDGTT